MVTQERKMVSISAAEKIIKESKNQEDAIKALHSLPKRQPRPPAPEGGISLREAARKYGVHSPTISRWVKRGYINILLRTKNELYIDEAELAKVIKIYKESPGQGRITLKQKLSSS